MWGTTGINSWSPPVIFTTLASVHSKTVSVIWNAEWLLTLEALKGLAPTCISELLIPCKPEHSLRSSGKALLAVPQLRLMSKGVCAFSVLLEGNITSLPLFLFQWFLANLSYQEALSDTQVAIVNILSSTSGDSLSVWKQHIKCKDETIVNTVNLSLLAR